MAFRLENTEAMILCLRSAAMEDMEQGRGEGSYSAVLIGTVTRADYNDRKLCV